MNVSQATKIWLEYHRAHSKHNTIRAYEFAIAKFNQIISHSNLNEVSTDDILDFMSKFTEGQKPQTKRIHPLNQDIKRKSKKFGYLKS